MSANAQHDHTQPNFDFIDDEKPVAVSAFDGAQISTLEEVKAHLAKKHEGHSLGANDPIWMLYSMFEVFVSDLAVVLKETETRQDEERNKLTGLVGESAKVLSEHMQGELAGLSTILKGLREDAAASSVQNLLQQQAQFSSELSALTSKIKRFSTPLYLFTALNWFAVGAFYLILK